jgi:hypothetical protein
MFGISQTLTLLQNAKDLQTTMDNLSQWVFHFDEPSTMSSSDIRRGMFWSASDILFNVDQICHEASEFLARAIKRKISDHDMALLEQALAHALVCSAS